MQALNSGDIEVPIFSKMTHQEFQPSKWKEMIERRIMKNASKYEDNMQASTDMFTCRKCRSKRCTYYEMQTRSADEPSTIFITCLNCGKNWRQ
jgi:transcription elongation factor S-II